MSALQTVEHICLGEILLFVLEDVGAVASASSSLLRAVENEHGWLLEKWRRRRGWSAPAAAVASPGERSRAFRAFAAATRSATLARAFRDAVAVRDLAAMRRLSEAGASQRHVDPSTGWTALHEAVTRGDRETVELEAAAQVRRRRRAVVQVGRERVADAHDVARPRRVLLELAALEELAAEAHHERLEAVEVM